MMFFTLKRLYNESNWLTKTVGIGEKLAIWFQLAGRLHD